MGCGSSKKESVIAPVHEPLNNDELKRSLSRNNFENPETLNGENGKLDIT
jgi:hypothetical protein